MKASELINKLQQLIKEHGDQEIYSGGEDYPGEVIDVWFIGSENTPYVPKNSFKIHGGI